MAAFHFRLQQVLGLFQVERDARAAALGRAQAALDGARRRRDDQMHALERRLEAARPGAGEPLDLDTWSAGRADYQGARRQEAAAVVDLQEAEAHADAAQGEYLDARRRQQILDRLRERRHQEWRAAEAAADQAVLDEAGGRKGGGAGDP